MYTNTINEIRSKLFEKYPNIRPEEGVGEMSGDKLVANILWMADQIEKMDSKDVGSQLKASRWIGWMLRAMEGLGIWDNAKTRDLIRSDKF